jgi:hypothetical protein
MEDRGTGAPPEADTALAAYESLLAARASLDFDDLVVRAVRLLDEDPPLRDRWQSRFSHVLVDEFQDVDAAQLRLVRLLAAPEDNLFVVGPMPSPECKSGRILTMLRERASRPADATAADPKTSLAACLHRLLQSSSRVDLSAR